MGRLLDEDDVIDAINKRISVLQKHPEFRRKHADIDLYGIKQMIAELPPASDLISRKAAIALADILKDDLPDDEQIADTVMARNEGILEYQTALSLLFSAPPDYGVWRLQALDMME